MHDHSTTRVLHGKLSQTPNDYYKFQLLIIINQSSSFNVITMIQKQNDFLSLSQLIFIALELNDSKPDGELNQIKKQDWNKTEPQKT